MVNSTTRKISYIIGDYQISGIDTEDDQTNLSQAEPGFSLVAQPAF